MDMTGKLVTTYEDWGTQQIWCLSLQQQPLFPYLSRGCIERQGLGKQNPYKRRRRSDQNLLRNLIIYLWVTSEWDVSQSPEGIGWPNCQVNLHIFKKSRQSSEVTGNWKRETLYPSYERVERRTLGATNLSTSPLCQGTSWDRSS